MPSRATNQRFIQTNLISFLLALILTNCQMPPPQILAPDSAEALPTPLPSPSPLPPTSFPAEGPYPLPLEKANLAGDPPYPPDWVSPTPTNLQTQHPTPTLAPSITPTLWHPIFYPECNPNDTVQICFDELLKMEFSIPLEWGEIEAMLREGWDTGLAYFYTFDSSVEVEAGGRSADFAEGRSGTLSDFMGFSQSSKEDRCGHYYYAEICDDVQPEVYLYFLFPQAYALCYGGPHALSEPYMLVAINLPANDKINGFVFTGNMLAGDTRTSYEEDLDLLIGPYEEEINLPTYQGCDENGSEIFDQQIQLLIEDVRAGEVDPETLVNIEVWLQLARSIRFLE